jgi:lysyl-tRNA synthetase class II
VEAKDGGDDEAMYFDHDFIARPGIRHAPTGGCGIGIDRFMMLLTDSASIRDVILFPACAARSEKRLCARLGRCGTTWPDEPRTIRD